MISSVQMEKRKKIRVDKMSDEELYKLSLKKNKLGCATKEALEAQHELWVRSGRDISDGYAPETDHWDGGIDNAVRLLEEA